VAKNVGRVDDAAGWWLKVAFAHQGCAMATFSQSDWLKATFSQPGQPWWTPH